MNDLLQSAKQILASQPFSVLVGAELTSFAPALTELTISITPQLKQQHGSVHTALIARATVIHAGKTQAVCRCDVFAISEGQETLCAVAQGTIARRGRSPQDPA
jgi:acyl-coenzyme A thioesterase PaaI-like protein